MSFPDYLQTQPLLRVAAALALGIFAGDAMAASLPTWAWPAAIAVCLLTELLLKGHPYAQSLTLLTATALAGGALITLANSGTTDPFPDDRPITYEGVVIAEPQVRGKVIRCDVAVTKVGSHTVRRPVQVKAAILRDTVNNNWRQIRPGIGIRAMSVMQPLVNWRKGGNFDYVRWLHCHGFRAQTFIYYTDWQPARVSLASLGRIGRLRLRALKLRHELVSRLQIGGSGSEYGDDQGAAVVAAMVLGDKHALSRETKDDYSVSGASHVLALSGLHLGIIYYILTLLFRRFTRKWPVQVIILTAVWSFVVIVGMGTSVMRSAVMLTICSLCIVAGRSNASVNALSLAAIVLLVANPLCLWDIGFQMSFMSVLAIATLFRPIFRLLPNGGGIFKAKVPAWIVKKVWGAAVVSIVAQIGSAPLVAYYFGRFSCYFLLTNFLVIPCAYAIIYGSLAVLATAPLPALGYLLAKALTGVSTFLNSSVGWIASLPGASIDNIRINSVQVFCVYILIATVCALLSYLRKLKPKYRLHNT